MMAARRTIYLVLLAATAALHLVYGQYVTHYMVIFLLCVPLISLIASIPSALGAEVSLKGGGEVCRGGKGSVLMTFESSAHFPPEAWRITVDSRNEFTGSEYGRQKIRITGETSGEKEFSPETSKLGLVNYRIKRAFVFDHLGLIPIPVKKSGAAGVTVVPISEEPLPEPDLDADSTLSFMPKQQGFSEEHELRPYRAGDQLNLIHWKLSRKCGALILREPQQAVRKDIVIVIEPSSDYEPHRSVLEQLCYLNDILNEKKIPYMLQYGHKTYTINCLDDYRDFIIEALASPMRGARERYIATGRDALVYRIRPGRGSDA